LKNNPSSLLLDVRAAAQLIGCTEKSLRARVARHVIPYKKLGKRILFPREELLHFINNLPGVTLAEARANQEARIP
jgi:excisionase family DNA binding protein